MLFLLFFLSVVKSIPIIFLNGFRMKLEFNITNTLDFQSEVDVPVTINTSSLISEGNLYSDCTDIGFVLNATNGENFNFSSFWRMSECDTWKTVFWIRVKNFRGKELITLDVYSGYNFQFENQEVKWNGSFISYSKDSCLGSWTTYSHMVGAIPKIKSSFTPYVTGSVNKHKHRLFLWSLDESTTMPKDNCVIPGGVDPQNYTRKTNHDHSSDEVITGIPDESYPNCYEVVFCNSSELTFYPGYIGLFFKDVGDDKEKKRFREMDNRVPKGGVAGSLGGNCGALQHIHPVVLTKSSRTYKPPKVACKITTTGGFNASYWDHDHDVSISTSKSCSNNVTSIIIPHYVYTSDFQHKDYVFTELQLVLATSVPPYGFRNITGASHNRFIMGGDIFGQLREKGSSNGKHSLWEHSEFFPPKTNYFQAEGSGAEEVHKFEHSHSKAKITWMSQDDSLDQDLQPNVGFIAIHLKNVSHIKVVFVGSTSLTPPVNKTKNGTCNGTQCCNGAICCQGENCCSNYNCTNTTKPGCNGTLCCGGKICCHGDNCCDSVICKKDDHNTPPGPSGLSLQYIILISVGGAAVGFLCCCCCCIILAFIVLIAFGIIAFSIIICLFISGGSSGFFMCLSSVCCCSCCGFCVLRGGKRGGRIRQDSIIYHPVELDDVSGSSRDTIEVSDGEIVHIDRNNLDHQDMKIEFSRLVLLKELGKGGSSSTVFECLLKPDGKKVALKKFHGLFCDKTVFDEFIKEFNALFALRSSYICQMEGYIFEENEKLEKTGEKKPPHMGIVMELCENGDLETYIRKHGKLRCKTEKVRNMREGIDLALKLKWMKQVVLGLWNIHKGKKFHRDIKPKNVGLTENLDAKILDFGLAKSIVKDEDYGHTNNIGTGFYIAPEVRTRGGTYGMGCDIYSFGMMFFCVLTEIFTAEEIFEKKFDLFTPAEELSPRIQVLEEVVGELWIVNLVKDCCEFDHTKRPTCVEILESFNQNMKVTKVDLDEEEEKKEIIEEEEEPEIEAVDSTGVQGSIADLVKTDSDGGSAENDEGDEGKKEVEKEEKLEEGEKDEVEEEEERDSKD